MIKGVIFDCGGVVVSGLYTEEFLREANKVFGVSYAVLKKNHDKFAPLHDTGKMSLYNFWSKVLEIPLSKLNRGKAASLYRDLYLKKSTVNKKVLKLVDNLRKNYKIGMLSDTVRQHVRINQKRGVFKHFDYIVLSTRAGLRKPDRRVFSLILRKMKLKPSEVVFIDDYPIHVKAAKKLGMHAILFLNFAQLKKDLRKKPIALKN